jgi:hypothetical protein
MTGGDSAYSATFAQPESSSVLREGYLDQDRSAEFRSSNSMANRALSVASSFKNLPDKVMK